MKVLVLCLLAASVMADFQLMMLADVFDFTHQVYEDAVIGGGPANAADYNCDPRHLNTSQVCLLYLRLEVTKQNDFRSLLTQPLVSMLDLLILTLMTCILLLMELYLAVEKITSKFASKSKKF